MRENLRESSEPIDRVRKYLSIVTRRENWCNSTVCSSTVDERERGRESKRVSERETK